MRASRPLRPGRSLALQLLGLLALAASLPLQGCANTGDDLSRTFGLTRDAPDEFTVTTRAPLSMPPDYSLRPPQPGASRPQELSSRQAAEGALAPQTILQGTAGPSSAGQQALVSQAGPAAPSDIRSKLRGDALLLHGVELLVQLDADGQLDHAPVSFTNRLMFWQSGPALGTEVDAARESQRLRQNAALGQTPSAGDTPIIQPPKNQGLFGNLF